MRCESWIGLAQSPPHRFSIFFTRKEISDIIQGQYTPVELGSLIAGMLITEWNESNKSFAESQKSYAERGFKPRSFDISSGEFKDKSIEEDDGC